jgi:hypothetical protein
VKLVDIKKAQIIEGVVAMEISGELFLMRKEELIQNSYFLTICT